MIGMQRWELSGKQGVGQLASYGMSASLAAGEMSGLRHEPTFGDSVHQQFERAGQFRASAVGGHNLKVHRQRA